MNFRQNNGRGTNSILACLMAMVMGLTLASCASNEDNAVVVGPSSLADRLGGWWYAEYDETGTVEANPLVDGERQTFEYKHVIDFYNFPTKDGGAVCRFYFGEDPTMPVAKQRCRVSYSSIEENPMINADNLGTGFVSVTIGKSDVQWKEFPAGTTSFYYDNGKLTGEGINGHQITMEQPTEDVLGVLLAWRGGETDAGGIGRKIDLSYVDAYKPNVDHSRWMAPLNDSRLVADLSLPGTHDACTAEGWHTFLFHWTCETSAKAQDLTIDEQLKVGVRVFDLRPERCLNTEIAEYQLRCSHGMIQTELLVKDFFLKLKAFLAENPTEFCIVTCNLTNTNDPVGYDNWKDEFPRLLGSSEFSGLFADFQPRLTVGDMRGKVLLLSRYAYDGKTIGGICNDWSNSPVFEEQVKGTIVADGGLTAPLWTQDYYSLGFYESGLATKDNAIRRMLDATAACDLTASAPAWVFNYAAGYMGMASSNHYRENATRTNRLVIDYLKNPFHTASTGIIYMDYAGMDKTPGFEDNTVYEACGLQLVEALINQNFRTQGTYDGSLFSVCTLNVDGLPALPHINDDGPGTTFTPVISRYLADKDFDFIGVQENFNFNLELGRSLTANYDHDSWGGEMWFDNLFNDGVHVAVFHTDGCKSWWKSYMDVVRTDSIRWNDRYGYADHCLDEAATKGFRRYELTTPDGYQLVVYNMHMEASERWDEVGGTDDGDRAARLKQWIQLREHIYSKLDTRPVLVIGDFNTYYCRDDMKANFIDAINASGRATCGDAWIEKCRGGVYPKLEDDVAIKDDGDYLGWTIRGEMPDKILYINPTGGHSVELLSCTYDNAAVSHDYFKPSGYAKDHEEPLGDHFPLFATFRLK